MADTKTVSKQPGSSITKQLGLTITTTRLRGDYAELEAYANTVNVGLPPPAKTGNTDYPGVNGTVTALHLQREPGPLASLAISVATKDPTETWLLEWIELQKDIRTWPGTKDDPVSLALLTAWENLKDTNPTAYAAYQTSAEASSSNTLTGSTLTLAKMIREKFITSILSFTPSITRVSTLTSLESFASNVGKIETPTASTDTTVGALDITNLTNTATAWLKTADRIQSSLDGTFTRTETWIGADEWNENLYAKANTNSSSNT